MSKTKTPVVMLIASNETDDKGLKNISGYPTYLGLHRSSCFGICLKTSCGLLKNECIIIWFWCFRLQVLTHYRAAKAQARLCFCTVSPEPSLFANTNVRKADQKLDTYIPKLDRFACMLKYAISVVTARANSNYDAIIRLSQELHIKQRRKKTYLVPIPIWNQHAMLHRQARQ